MVLGLSLRVSWICLLLFSSGACFPATKGDYKYPYTATWLSAGGSAPGSSNIQSGGSRPLVSLQHGPSANLQQPAVSVQQASSPTGQQSPSSLGAPSSVATGSSPSYQPNRFLVTYDSSAPVAPSSAGYVSPPVGTGTKTPSFFVQPQPAASSSGNSNLGSYSPVYEASSLSFAYPAGNTGPTSQNTAATGGLDDGPVPYQDPFSDSSLSWGGMPEGAVAFPSAPVAHNPSAWMPPRPFPDFRVWDSAQEDVSQETSPLPPSSYIIQSRNGYQRAREVSSHMTYSPEYLPPVFGSKTVKALSVSAPGTGSKGGQKV